MKRTILVLSAFTCVAISACSRAHSSNLDAAQVRAKLDAIPLDQPVTLTNNEWQLILSPEQFYVMRRAGTERPAPSGNALEHPKGNYVCSA